jgi:hypothetical protein
MLVQQSSTTPDLALPVDEGLELDSVPSRADGVKHGGENFVPVRGRSDLGMLFTMNPETPSSNALPALSALKDLYKHHDDGNDQQGVKDATQGVSGQQSQGPENQ